MFARMDDKAPRDHAVFGVVLAAGESRRFGAPKQLAEFDGAPLVRAAADVARRCFGARSLLVVGHEAEAVARAAGGGCEFLLVNDRYVDGLGSSVALAASVLAPVADAVVLLLADQPLIEADHVRRLVAGWSGRARHALATDYGNGWGPPVLIPKGLFGELQSLDGDRGAHALLESPDVELERLRFTPAGVDVDTPDDLQRLRRPNDRGPRSARS